MYLYLPSNSCISDFGPPSLLAWKKTKHLIIWGEKTVCVDRLSDLVWETSFDQITSWTSGLWLIGEWIAQAPWVSAASYLFITGTRLDLTSVLFPSPIWHKKNVLEEDTVLFFLTISPPPFFLNEYWSAYGFPDTKQTSRMLELFQQQHS